MQECGCINDINELNKMTPLIVFLFYSQHVLAIMLLSLLYQISLWDYFAVFANMMQLLYFVIMIQIIIALK